MSETPPLFTKRDARAAMLLASSYLATALVPRLYDKRVIPFLADVLARLMPGRITRREEEMLAAIGEATLPNTRYDDAREYARQRFEDRWLRGRYQHRRPAVLTSTVTGLEHYQKGLERGNGVILWRARFCDSPAVNAALWQAGIKATHLSLDRHGAGASRAGIAVISPWWAQSEARWLERRILIPSAGGLGYLKELLELLGNNGTLSIFAEDVQESRAPIRTTVLGREIALPSGAPALSHRTRAALLPLFAASPAPLQYDVTIEPPIDVDHGPDRRRYVRLAAEEFASRFEEAIRRDPASWVGWRGYDRQEGE